MKEKIIADLGVNFKNGDDSIIENYIELYSSIASDNSNRKIDDTKLYPYIYTAVKEAYLRRGDEGSSSSTEGSLSTSYVDIEEKLAKDVRKVRVIK